jgi:hypothetical protein
MIYHVGVPHLSDRIRALGVALALSTLGCVSSEDDSTCSAGDISCKGGVAAFCDKGAWVGTPCAKTEYCVLAPHSDRPFCALLPGPDPNCTTEGRTCLDHAVLGCSKGYRVSYEDCATDGGTCVDPGSDAGAHDAGCR